jgi:hypothetical protein
MGLMDKVKSQAAQVVDKAQQAGQAGQAKLAEVQAKRKADGMLEELGTIVYLERTGRTAPGGEARATVLVDDLQKHEAEHGPITMPSGEG